MKHFKFQIKGNRPEDKLSPDEIMPLLEAVDRRLPDCSPGHSGELAQPRSPLEIPVGRPGDMVLNLVPVEYVTMQATDEVSLTAALQVVNDSLRDIGRSNLWAELREL